MKYIPKDLGEHADYSRDPLPIVKQARNLFITVFTLIGLYAVLGFTADMLALMIPPSVEEKLPIPLMGAPFPADEYAPPKLIKVRSLVEQFVATGKPRPLNYKLFVLGGFSPNAVAMPGGGLGISYPLLDMLEHDRALALVLAHELGHHYHRHTLRGLGRRLLWTLGQYFIFGGTDADSFTDVSLEAATMRYSQSQELEADRFAIDLVWETFGDLDGSFEFFVKIDRLGWDKGPGWQTMFRTHPPSADRLIELQKRAKELMGEKYVDPTRVHTFEEEK